MKIYFAPMEAVTVYTYRNAFHSLWGDGIDKYFSPFISPTPETDFKKKEFEDILPENNKGLELVPQLLTNNAQVFVRVSQRLSELGYAQVNLNLGCPSGTVTSKRKGSGFLAFPEELDSFLYEIYSKCEIDISVKTRIGVENREEFYRLLDIYNKYPITELIIHPRLKRDMYKNQPDMEMFDYAMKNSKNPLCYNGDIFDIEVYNKISARFPRLQGIMLGRGLVGCPGLAQQIKYGRKQDNKKVLELYELLYERYRAKMNSERNVLFKMKELWFYMINSFEDSDKIFKKIKKSQNLVQYEAAVAELYKCAGAK